MKRPREEAQTGEDIAALREEAIAFAGIGLCRIRLDGTVEYIDAATIKLFESEDRFPDPNDVIGENIGDLFDFILPHETVRNALLAGEPVHEFEYPLRTWRGTAKWALLDAFLVTSSDGVSKALQAVFRDITGRKLAEMETQHRQSEYRVLLDALRESERRFRHLAEATTDYVFSVRMAQGQPVETVHGPACVAVTGYTAQEFHADPYLWIHMVPEEDRPIVRQQGEQMQSKGEALPVEHRLVRKDGAVRWVRNVTVAHRDEHGQITSYDGLIQDITERKAAEEALRQSEQRFRLLVEHAADALFLHDDEGVILDANRQACESLGYTHDQLLGLRITDFQTAQGSEALKGHWKRLQPGQKVGFEGVHRRSDGGFLPVEVLVTEFQSGARPLFLSQARDITERRRAERERRRLEAQVQQAQKLESLGVLAGGIAHDFNNLLMSIMGNIDLVIEETPATDSRLGWLKGIELAARRAADLCQQMLAYSGKGRFAIEKIDLNRLVSGMTQLLEISISKKSALEYDFAGNLPSIEADAVQIRQVVMNLITNASEAYGEEPGTIVLRTSARPCDRNFLNECYQGSMLPEGVYVCLEAADAGCGMDAAVMERMFDPFFTTKFTGRGLGLAAVLGIVRGHEGTVKVISALGRGTRFQVFFPAVEGAATEAKNAAAATEPWRGKGAILIVDDEEAVRIVGRHMLERLGFTVFTAADGVDGVEQFEAHADAIDAVILDLIMPRMGGEEALKAMRRIQPDVRVLLSSGYDEQQLTERFSGQGVAEFIQKPYRSATLIEKLRVVLGS
jgi:PAS domain S-box-containing protein